MRILMLAQFLYPPVTGGEERHVADLSRELAARGHEVSIVTLRQKGFPEFEIKQGVRIYRISGTMQRMGMLFSESNRRYVPPFPDPELLAALRLILIQERPDIVHAHDWIGRSFTPLKKLSKARLVATLHSYGHICVQKRLTRHGVNCSGPGLMKCLECATRFYGLAKGPPSMMAHYLSTEHERRVVDMFLPVSQAVAEGNQLAKHRLPYRVIPNFVPETDSMVCDESSPLLAQLPKEDFLLFVGDMTLDKGAGVLMDAYKIMDSQMPLVFIGRPFLASRAEGLANVRLLGSWSHDAVMTAWRRSLIGLIPSTWPEACPTVAMEAMAMGKPVIASSVGGLVDIVANEETGLLVPPGDPQALGRAIQCLLNDPERREQMGKMARQRVTRFQTKMVIPQIEQVYHEVLAV
jgi:glycosyltransferase involved in cell wall biosynthesis